MAPVAQVQVVVDLSGCRQFRTALRAGLMGHAGPVRDALQLWANEYLSFTQERFDVFSKGGGNWAPLAESTERARRDVAKVRRNVAKARRSLRKAVERKRKATRVRYSSSKPKTALRKTLQAMEAMTKAKVRLDKWRRREGAIRAKLAILRDTNTLFNTLSPSIEMPGQVRRHIPFGIEIGFGGGAAHPKGDATIADIARFHQEGNASGNLPAREILVMPDVNVLNRMTLHMLTALRKLIKGSV